MRVTLVAENDTAADDTLRSPLSGEDHVAAVIHIARDHLIAILASSVAADEPHPGRSGPHDEVIPHDPPRVFTVGAVGAGHLETSAAHRTHLLRAGEP